MSSTNQEKLLAALRDARNTLMNFGIDNDTPMGLQLRKASARATKAIDDFENADTDSLKPRTKAIRDAAAQVPRTWLDGRLTGPKALLEGKGGTWGCPDVERLLNRIRADIMALDSDRVRSVVRGRKSSNATRASKKKRHQ